jgi:translation initiation factor IF-1
MVKNTLGGNKSKGFARKNMVKRDTRLRVAEEEGEIYAQAVKVMGGSIASAIDIDGNPLRAHIRGKFRGRGKRDNFISPGTWLLVGLHTWEADKPDEIKNCDVLEVYSDLDKQRLMTSVTSVNWSIFLSNDTSSSHATTDDKDARFTFEDDVTQEYEQLITSSLTTTTTKSSNLKAAAVAAVEQVQEDEEEINVDDI